MNAKQERLYQSFRRVQGWIGGHPELTTSSGTSAPTGVSLATQAAALDAVIQQAATRASQQDTNVRAARGAAVDTRRLRTELLTHEMSAVATIARTTIPDVVLITEALRMPKTRLRAEPLIAAAESMAVLGEKYQAQLVSGGLPSDFVAQLRSVAVAYKQSIDARGQAVVGRKGATEGLDAQLATGRRVVETLSVMVRRRLRQDTVALAEWQQARRVTIKGAQPRSQVTPPPVGTAAAAATPAVASTAPVVTTASAVVASTEPRHQTA